MAGNQDFGKPTENVIFLHGFMSSSFIWTETVFPELVSSKCRLFAVDLLGFGNSPKPRDCLYTLNDHVEMVEKSVIREFELDSFHLVAHSMGCVIALALAAKHPNKLKSITLVAPVSLYVQYFNIVKVNGSTFQIHNHITFFSKQKRKLYPKTCSNVTVT